MIIASVVQTVKLVFALTMSNCNSSDSSIRPLTLEKGRYVNRRVDCPNNGVIDTNPAITNSDSEVDIVDDFNKGIELGNNIVALDNHEANNDISDVNNGVVVNAELPVELDVHLEIEESSSSEQPYVTRVGRKNKSTKRADSVYY